MEGFGAPYGNECPGAAGAGACNDHGQCSDGAGGSGSCSCDLSYYVRTAAISAPGEPRTRAQGMVDAARFLALVPARHLMQGTGQAATAVPVLLGTTAPVVRNARNAGTGHATRA